MTALDPNLRRDGSEGHDRVIAKSFKIGASPESGP